MTQRNPFVAFVLGASLSLGASRALADTGDLASKFPVDDSNPSAHLPTPEQRDRDPLEFGYLIQDLLSRGEGGFIKKDWARAVKYYEAVARAVPDRALPFSRLCSAYAELGKLDVAAAYCGRALSLGGAQVADHFSFIRVSLRRKNLTPTDVADLDASIVHLRQFAATQPAQTDTTAEMPAAEAASATAPLPPLSGDVVDQKSADQINAENIRRKAEFQARRDAAKLAQQKATAEHIDLPLAIEVAACKLAVRLADSQRLDACLKGLEAVKADPKVALAFSWTQALLAKDQTRAKALVEQAKAMHLPEAALRPMLAEQDKVFGTPGFVGAIKRTGFAGLLALITFVPAVAGSLWWGLSRLRRRKLSLPVVTQPASEIRNA